MRKLLACIAELFFPPTDEALTVRTLSPYSVHNLLAPVSLPSAVALSSFRDEKVRALIHEAKFHQNERAFVLLSCLIARYLEEHSVEYDFIIPIPLSPRRLRERGYNQVEAVLRVQELPIPILSDTLVRTRHTRPQTELGRTERLGNMSGVFTVIHPESVTGRRILLIDDVITTGATLSAARMELARHSPASITCLAFAH